MSDPILSISDLWVTLVRRHAPDVALVRGVDLDLARGESLGLVGESGAGKSLTCYAALGLVERAGLQVSGSVTFDGTDLSTLDRTSRQHVRGARIAMVFQEPSVSLNPTMTVGRQIADVVRHHTRCTKRAALERTVECLGLAGVPNPKRRADEYPHTLSGGLKQRAMIALAISCEPDVLVADEATTALDVTMQAQVLALLRRLQRQLGMSMIVVTHDLGVVSHTCDRVAVMYAGQVVEQASVDDLFRHPRHPYTEGLLAAVPSVRDRSEQIQGIPGVVPRPEAELSGCWFAPRCAFADDRCRGADVAMETTSPNHLTRCVRASELDLAGVGVGAGPARPAPSEVSATQANTIGPSR